MRILFVAKHNSGDNDDEGAVAYSLEKLGHEVIRVHELQRHRNGVDPTKINADMCLFFKWESYSEIAEIDKRMPVVCWYFDLLSSEDPTLAARMRFRRDWFARVSSHCTLMFFTDGDWVDRCDHITKLRWLMQGMDERVAGFGTPLPEPQPPILFTGTPHHGAKRAEHIQQLRDRYGKDFQVLGEGGPNKRIHGRALADLFASVKVVIAPDGPCTDRYWSNRVYLTTGLGGLLLHPWCEGLVKQYGTDLLYYSSRESLNEFLDKACDLSDCYLSKTLAYNRTMAEHTYTHRCEQLMKMVQEVL